MPNASGMRRRSDRSGATGPATALSTRPRSARAPGKTRSRNRPLRRPQTVLDSSAGIDCCRWHARGMVSTVIVVGCGRATCRMTSTTLRSVTDSSISRRRPLDRASRVVGVVVAGRSVTAAACVLSISRKRHVGRVPPRENRALARASPTAGRPVDGAAVGVSGMSISR